MHLQPMFDRQRAFVNGTSEWLFNNGITLPSGSRLADSDIERVQDVIRTAVCAR
jgi:dTDP-4-amino-4,6-dideoxygalactose transaminase